MQGCHQPVNADNLIPGSLTINLQLVGTSTAHESNTMPENIVKNSNRQLLIDNLLKGV